MTPLLEARAISRRFGHVRALDGADFAVHAGDACRYPADVAPFAAVGAPTAAALQQVHSLLAPGELVYLIGERYPHIPELSFGERFGVLQMVLPEEVSTPDSANDDSAAEIVPLTDANAN